MGHPRCDRIKLAEDNVCATTLGRWNADYFILGKLKVFFNAATS